MKSRWKVIALKAPRTGYYWIAKGVDTDNQKDAIWPSHKIIQRYVEEARRKKIWLLHRRVGKPGAHTWELVWDWRKQR